VSVALVEMSIRGLMIDPITNMPIVILKDADDQRTLPIWVGPVEANAIAIQMENITTPRPMTHDLLVRVMADLGATVDRVVVADLSENTFYAQLILRRGDGVVVVDARPSDALAVALRTKARVFVSEHVLDRAQSLDTSAEQANQERLQRWLESLDPDDLGYKM
jgi:bifunctional DNase/RNase